MAEKHDNELYKHLLRVYFDNANDGVFLLCDSMQFYAVNQRLESWLGVVEHRLTNDDQRAVITEFLKAQDDRDQFQCYLELALTGQPSHFQCELHPDKAEARLLEVNLSRVDLEEGGFVIGIARDVTERRNLLNTLEYQALHDELTGLANRRNFLTALDGLLEDARAHQRTHTLLYLDLDHFKVINDTSGHHVGDQCLLMVTELLRQQLGERDLLARVGGDEFAILLWDTTPEESKASAEAWCALLAKQPLQWQDKTFKITASLGYTAIQADAEDTHQLLSYADAACYVAKDLGRNSVMEYYGGVRCSGKRQEMDWVNRIHDALAHDRFVIHYQEIRPTHGPAATHNEVLLRMRGEDGELIAPGIFIPAAERYDLMPAIDRWVVRAVFDMLRKAGSAVREVVWTINLSGASVSDKEFVSDLFRALADPQVPTDNICFEITETMAISNLAHAQEFMQRARALGCKIALDDFGSGMSSFAYLKNLPVDCVKIDGSLIVNVDKSAADRAIVESINNISHTLGFKTVAEFVENEAILAAVRDIGVDFVQGYGIHCPEPIPGADSDTDRVSDSEAPVQLRGE